MLKTIYKRRSIRAFRPEPVSAETLQELIRAAMHAPSAGDERPWQFVIVDDRELLRRIPTVHPYASMVPTAPAAILVCGDLQLESHKGFWVQDCSAAVQNLLLAVTAHGLGAVWLGVHPREDRVEGLRRLLGLPQHVVPLALVPVGRPAEEPAPEDRFEPAKIHRNGW